MHIRPVYSCIVILTLVGVSWEFNCAKINSCKCKLDDGTYINLRKLGSKDGSPRFKDVLDVGVGDVWSYNPCHGFTENACNDVAVCQIRNGAGISTGTQESAQFKYDESNGLAVVYTAVSDIVRTTYVFLQCEPAEEAVISALGEIVADGNYYLYLASKYACPRADDDDDDDEDGISGGTVLIIIAIVLISVYLIGGTMFLTIHKKAQGTERIPNYTFWAALPGLIKEGCMFTCNTAKSKAGYASI